LSTSTTRPFSPRGETPGCRQRVAAHRPGQQTITLRKKYADESNVPDLAIITKLPAIAICVFGRCVVCADSSIVCCRFWAGNAPSD